VLRKDPVVELLGSIAYLMIGGVKTRPADAGRTDSDMSGVKKQAAAERPGTPVLQSSVV
jgi:hypothetical protein